MPDIAGRYWGAVKSAVTGRSKNGSPQVVIEFDVTHIAQNGEFAELPNPLQRRVYLSLSGGAEPYTLEKLERLHFNGDFRNVQLSPDNGGCELDCYQDTYNGATKMKWELATGAASEVEPAPDDVVRQLNAKWAAMHKPATRPAGRPAPAAGAPNAARRATAPATSPSTTTTAPPQAPTHAGDPDGQPDHIPF